MLLTAGIPPVLTGFIGIAVGGLITKRFKLRPQQVTYFMITSSVIGAICYFSAIAMGCDMQNIVGVDGVPDPYNLYVQCSSVYHLSTRTTPSDGPTDGDPNVM